MQDRKENDEKQRRRLDRLFNRIEGAIPHWLARILGFLRHPAAMIIRIPLGILFVIGGILSFLPVLGIWMLPLGLLLLAVDLPALRPPVTGIIMSIQSWMRRRARRGGTNKEK